MAVRCAPVETGTVEDSVTLRGVLGTPPDKDAIIAPAVSGRVAEIRVHEGDSVRKGESLASIDNPQVISEREEAAAALSSALAKAEKAHAALTRVKSLYEEGVIARKEVDDAQAEAAAADGEVRASRAKDAEAEAQASRARVPSPIDGVVMRVSRKIGELVDGTPATPLAEVADPAMLELVADVPAADVVRLSAGDSAQVTLDALPGVPLPGKVRLVSPSVDPVTSLGSVRVALLVDEATRKKLRLGLAGRASLSFGKDERALLVPAEALRRSAQSEDEVVVCAQEAGKLTARVAKVKLGARTDGRVEVVAGLSTNEQVVIKHLLGLEDGTPLALEGAPDKP